MGCAVMVGLAIVLSGSSELVGAQQLQQLQKVPKSAPLTGTRWLMAESAGQHVAQNGLQPYFELKMLEHYEDGSAGQLEDAADVCGNRLTGTYRVTADRLHVRITAGGYTLLACKVSESTPRQGLGTALAGSTQFQIRGSELDLLESNGMVRARFIAARGK